MENERHFEIITSKLTIPLNSQDLLDLMELGLECYCLETVWNFFLYICNPDFLGKN